jgi:hypothetical protein
MLNQDSTDYEMYLDGNRHFPLELDLLSNETLTDYLAKVLPLSDPQIDNGGEHHE